MNLEAFILGCGGMMPLPYRHLTSVLLRREGDLFLFDAGEGTQVSLRRLNLRWKKINTIFISHTHADHVTGLPGILMLSAQVDRDEPLYIIGPPKIKEYVETNRRVLDMYINYEIIIQEVTDPGVVYKTDEFQVRAFWLEHTKPCLGYVFEEFPRPGAFDPEAARRAGICQMERHPAAQEKTGASREPARTAWRDKMSARTAKTERIQHRLRTQSTAAWQTGLCRRDKADKIRRMAQREVKYLPYRYVRVILKMECGVKASSRDKTMKLRRQN